MQAAFLVSGFWDYTVLLGNLLSAAAAVLNFFLLGILHQAEPVLRETFHFTDPNGFPLCRCINEAPARSNQKEAMQIIA